MRPARSEISVLLPLLREAQTAGLVGPGSVEAHLDHVRGFAEVIGDPGLGRMLDLGSGAGLPGLGLALLWPASRWVLLDGRRRSAEFLSEAVGRLGVDGRVNVVEGRAEVVAHDPAYRATMDLVVARSVASPSTVAECAAGFLLVGGRLVVSDPPAANEGRWPEVALDRLGMRPSNLTESSRGFHFSVVDQLCLCPEPYPRRTGVPARRPLF